MYCWSHLDDSLQLTVQRKEQKESFFDRIKTGFFSRAAELNEMAQQAEEEFWCFH